MSVMSSTISAVSVNSTPHLKSILSYQILYKNEAQRANEIGERYEAFLAIKKAVDMIRYIRL